MNPLGIDEAGPRLSWIVESTERGQKQTAYRVIVATSPELLARDVGDLWDTGQVGSDETIHIVYGGAPLNSGARVFWKLRVWDKDGNPSAWSKPALWSMGLMDSGWKAGWIGRDASALEIHDIHFYTPIPTLDLNFKVPGPIGMQKIFAGGMARVYLPPPYLRKTFRAKASVLRATVYATALGSFELSLNGRRIGDDYFTPGWTDYKKRVYYLTYDVTEMVEEGENALGAILADGWYAGMIGLRGQRYYGDRPRFSALLDLEYADGSSETVVTDESWRSTLGPIRATDIQFGEVHDARLEMAGWNEPGFDDSRWQGVDVTREIDAAVESYPGIPVRKTMEIRPVAVTEPEPGVFVFDLGQNFAGWARLKVKGEAGDHVRLQFAEMLEDDGRVYTENLRTARAMDEYILKGGGEEIWEPRFTYHGFRYVEVTGYPGKPDLDALTGIVAHSDLAETGSIETDHPLVNRLFSNILWGQRSNYFEVPTDCPQRDERLGWTGDAQIFARTASYNMDVAPFFKKWMVDLTDGQHRDGSFPDVAPDVLGGSAAGWGDAGVICPHAIYKVYADTRIIERHYPAMTRFMDFLNERSPGGVSPALGFYGDWVNIDDPTPHDLVATAYHAYDCALMAEMAEAIGKQDDARMYRERFEKVKTAFAAKFVDEDGNVSGDSQTAYLMALGFDLLPRHLRGKAADHLVRRIAENDYCLSTGFLGLKMLLPVLTDIGQPSLAYRLLVNRKFPSWGYSIDQGATTVWERWNSYTIEDGFGPVSMNSFNHYAFGSVGEWMYSTMAGIDTDGPGYKRIMIAPRPGGEISRVKASYNSIRGLVKTSWRFDGDDFLLEITVPANTAATVVIPALGADSVLEGGGKSALSPFIRLLREDPRAAVFEVDSGAYSFVSVGGRRAAEGAKSQ